MAHTAARAGVAHKNAYSSKTTNAVNTLNDSEVLEIVYKEKQGKQGVLGCTER